MQSPGALRHNGNFQILWISQALSSVGTGAAAIAYPLLILSLTHSVALAGLVGTITLVAALVAQLPGGAVADRFDRRLIMITCDGARTCALLALGLLVLLHFASWPIVLVIAVIESVFGVLFAPASMAALPAIVADEQLEPAWAATEGRQYAAAVVGPPVGGLLFGLASALPFLGDALSYVVSVVLVRSMRGRFRPPGGPARRALWREVIEGIALVIRDPLLRAVVIAAPLLNFGINGMLFEVTVALRTHGTTAAIIGLVQAGFALGGIGGALLAPRLQGRLKMWQLGLGLAGVDALLMCIIALLLPSVALVVPLALVPVLAPATNAALIAAMMRRTNEHLRGRVTSTLILAMSGLAAFAPLEGALVADRWSFRVAVVVFAAATALAGAPIWFLRRAITANARPEDHDRASG